jgi:hypothetical protein
MSRFNFQFSGPGQNEYGGAVAPATADDEGDMTDDRFGDSASHVSFSHTFAPPAPVRRVGGGGGTGAGPRPLPAVGTRVLYLGKRLLTGVRVRVLYGVCSVHNVQ